MLPGLRDRSQRYNGSGSVKKMKTKRQPGWLGCKLKNDKIRDRTVGSKKSKKRAEIINLQTCIDERRKAWEDQWVR